MRPSSALVGEWHGTANVVNAILLDRAFQVSIYIHSDGRVTGSLGDTTLTDAHFLRHRPAGVTGGQRHDLMDYMIRGQLAGPLLAPEDVSAREVFIPLDYQEGKLKGAVHAHGTVISAKIVGILSSNLTLTKSSR